MVSDCGIICSGDPVCGNNVCEVGEICANCCNDCGQCTGSCCSVYLGPGCEDFVV